MGSIYRIYEFLYITKVLIRHYNLKIEILEKYLNLVYLGQDKSTAIKGFQEASKFAFQFYSLMLQ